MKPPVPKPLIVPKVLAAPTGTWPTIIHTARTTRPPARTVAPVLSCLTPRRILTPSSLSMLPPVPCTPIQKSTTTFSGFACRPKLAHVVCLLTAVLERGQLIRHNPFLTWQPTVAKGVFEFPERYFGIKSCPPQGRSYGRARQYQPPYSHRTIRN